MGLLKKKSGQNERKNRALRLVACQFPGALLSPCRIFFFFRNVAAKKARCFRHLIKKWKTRLSAAVDGTGNVLLVCGGTVSLI